MPALMEGKTDIIYDRELKELRYSLARSAFDVYVTQCNLAMLAVLQCNCHCAYIQDAKSGFYCVAYSLKANVEVSQMLTNTENGLIKFLNKEKLKANPRASGPSLGRALLCSAIYHNTKGQVVASQMSAILLLKDKDVFEYSHDFAAVPLAQALAFLENRSIRATIGKNGVIKALTYDYAFRNTVLETMNFWDYRERLDTFPKSQSKNKKNEEFDFIEPHPQFAKCTARYRQTKAVPKISGKKLPDLRILNGERKCDLTTEKIEELKEYYGANSLIMFYPWRKLSDIKVESTWWLSYLKLKDSFSPRAKQVLHNMQNVYLAQLKA
jgi:hypothetical protein